MSLAEFQHALADMTLDVRLASRVKAEGAAALARYRLSEREARRLVGVARQPGMALQCTLARANRFTVIAESFPMTCVVLEPVLRELLDALWAHDVPSGYQLTSEVAAFAALVAGDEALHARFAYLSEIFAYEQGCLELVAETRRRALADWNGPVRHLLFRHDPGALLPPLQAHVAPPDGLPLAPHRMEIELVDGALESRWFPDEQPGQR
jgi:hypothetical protein